MDNTIIQQGRFTSAGSAVLLPIRCDVDWMSVMNYTQIAANAVDTGYQFYWQRGGIAPSGAFEYRSNGAGTAIDLLTKPDNGFTLIDTVDYTLPARAALTGLTNAAPPVVTSAGHGLSVGDIVRFTDLDNQPQIGGIDFTVTTSGATFNVGNISLANSTASTAGYWRKVPYDPIYYPRRRYITFISAAAAPYATSRAKIYLSVTHGYTVGQEVRLSLPGGSSVWGNYAQLDGRLCTIMAVNAARAGSEPNSALSDNNIVVDIDVSTLGAWNVFGAGVNECYPAAAAVAFTPAQVVPVGQDTVEALSSGVIADDATINTGFIGMQLASGQTSPAGQADDVIFWRAGKSFSVLNV